MSIPHQFPTLLGNESQVVLIVGTGMSIPYAPTVDSLEVQLKKIAKDLGVEQDGKFYVIADNILQKLKQSKSEDASRLELAGRLGLFVDRKWFGETGLPLSGNTPRHRAIARFAVENRLRAIISLNWDALIEVALESVGLANCHTVSMPWQPTAYCGVVTNAHLPKLSNPHVFPVIKPHGCVRDLEYLKTADTTQQVTFKITSSDLSTKDATQNLVDNYVRSYLSACPVVAVGWKGAEDYLRTAVINVATATPRQEEDAFTLVSSSWYSNEQAEPHETYHDEIATGYGKTRDQCFVPVMKKGIPNLDCVFQWLQARYALDKIVAVADASLQAILQGYIDAFETLDCVHPVMRWVDGWLPVWVKLCWRSGVMQGFDANTNVKIEPWAIPVTPRDRHIPLRGLGDRRDLKAAAKLLAALGDELRRYDYLKYPGGLWDAQINTLYLPLPGWQCENERIDLSALKHLVEGMRSIGFIRHVKLVWMDDSSTAPDESLRRRLTAEVGRMMPHAYLAKIGALEWVTLESLAGGDDEKVA